MFHFDCISVLQTLYIVYMIIIRAKREWIIAQFVIQYFMISFSWYSTIRLLREQFRLGRSRNLAIYNDNTYLQYLWWNIHANSGQWRRRHWSGQCGSWSLLLQALPELRLSPLLLLQLLPHQLQLQLRTRRRSRCFESRRTEKSQYFVHVRLYLKIFRQCTFVIYIHANSCIVSILKELEWIAHHYNPLNTQEITFKASKKYLRKTSLQKDLWEISKIINMWNTLYHKREKEKGYF